MDDLFQIIIYILIGVSFFSQFFKKKKPVPPPSDGSNTKETNVTANQTDRSSQVVTESRQEPDFLKELEGFFNVGNQFAPPKKKAEQPAHDDKTIYEGAENRADYIKVPEDSFHKTTSSEHTFIDPWELKQKEIEKKKKAITPEIEKQASSYKENLEKTNTAAKGIVHIIRKRIKDPASFKEYIVISEIIGKPKAYRG